ncbi:MAG: flagellar assembly protein FliH [Burkholderiales bacterium]|nr:flagellar assembly protein FliH [Burkholderiales bacterium]
MKAWGSKKIFRGAEVPVVEPWQVGEFTGASVQRPHRHVQPTPEPEPMPVELPEAPPELNAEPETAEPAPPEVSLEDELAQLRNTASESGYSNGFERGRESGHAAGFEEGRAAGMADGHAQGLQAGRSEARDEVARFNALLTGLQTAITGYESTLAQPITDIALAVARQMVRTTLTNQPEHVLAVVRDALNSMPELQGMPRIEMHPDDIAILQTIMPNEAATGQWRFEPNTAIERGGCIISNTSVEVDLTLANRWRRIISMLGRDDAWLDEDADEPL